MKKLVTLKSLKKSNASLFNDGIIQVTDNAPDGIGGRGIGGDEGEKGRGGKRELERARSEEGGGGWEGEALGRAWETWKGEAGGRRSGER